jgi:DNA-3-methyladenine glycosylase I
LQEEFKIDCSIKLGFKMKRCSWVKEDSEIYRNYHDFEWGEPLKDDRALFELFSLETQAAGLSWLTILQKREAYRELFLNFEIEKVANFTNEEILKIKENKNIVRNLPKLNAIVHNAKLFLKIKEEFGGISKYFWTFVENSPIINSVPSYKKHITTSPVSDKITKDLKKRGFKFVGSITIYAFMQACGMVDDHENSCHKKSFH